MSPNFSVLLKFSWYILYLKTDSSREQRITLYVGQPSLAGFFALKRRYPFPLVFDFSCPSTIVIFNAGDRNSLHLFWR